MKKELTALIIKLLTAPDGIETHLLPYRLDPKKQLLTAPDGRNRILTGLQPKQENYIPINERIIKLSVFVF